MPMTDAKIDIKEKLDGLFARKLEIQEKISALQIESRKLDAEISDGLAAARFVGLELADLPVNELTSASEPDKRGSEQSIKAQIESALRAAYPKSLRSKEIR